MPRSRNRCLVAMQSSAGVGANLPDAEAYASAAGFDFGGGRNSSLEGPRPLLRGGSFSRGFALPMHAPGTTHSLTHSLTHTLPPVLLTHLLPSSFALVLLTTDHPLCTARTNSPRPCSLIHSDILIPLSIRSLTYTLTEPLTRLLAHQPTLLSMTVLVLHTSNIGRHCYWQVQPVLLSVHHWKALLSFMHVSSATLATLRLLATGGFKVNQLPTSPFEGARHPTATSASNSSDAPNGPFASRLINMSQSMDTTNSNSGGLQSGNQGDRDHPGAFRGLASSSSQKEVDRSPKGRESPFETLRQQQQQQQQVSF